MEKLVYLGWDASGGDGDALRERLLGELAPALSAGGAVAVQVSVADGAVGGEGVFAFSSEGSPKAVSYTHLDVYKRQR